MSWEKYLSDGELIELQRTLVQAGLATDTILDALMRGIRPAYVASLPVAGLPPAAKLMVQLTSMNRIANLSNGDVPLAQWLRAAIGLAMDLPQVDVFERALTKITNAGIPTTGLPDGLKDTDVANANLKIKPEVMVRGVDNTLPIRYLRLALEATQSVFKILVHRHLNKQPEFLAGDVPYLVSGTGWMLGPGLIITNHHVINARMTYPVQEADATPEDFELQAAHTTVYFDYFETDKPSAKVQLGSGALLAADKELDFAILRLPAGAPKRPPLTLRKNVMKKTLQQELGSRVNILQHPNGDPMRLGFRENFVVFGDAASLAYLTDTAGGSSGSPVADDAWAVAALHRGARDISDKKIELLGTKIKLENFGTPIPAIIAKLQAGNPALLAEIMAGQPGAGN